MSRSALTILLFLVACVAADGAPAFNFGKTQLLNADGQTDAGNVEEIQGALANNGTGQGWLASWTSRTAFGGSFFGYHSPRVAFSGDDGVTWVNRDPVDSRVGNFGVMLGNTTIANIGPNSWVLILPSNDNLTTTGFDLDLFCYRSTNNGISWLPRVTVNNNAMTDGNDVDNYPFVASNGGSTLVTMWDTTRILDVTSDTIDQDIVFARSTNSGAIWSDPVPVDSNFKHLNNTNDYFPKLATNNAGIWIAVWQRVLPPIPPSAVAETEICFSRSVDNGVSWSPVKYVYGAATVGAPESGPCVSFDGNQTAIIAWSHASAGGFARILVSRSTNGGANWGVPVTVSGNPDAGPQDNQFLGNITNNGHGIWLTSFVSTSTAGGTVTGYNYFYVTSTDNGVTWSPYGLISKNGQSASLQGATVLGNQHGVWTGIWSSMDSNIENKGSDWDVLQSTARRNGLTGWTNYP